MKKIYLFLITTTLLFLPHFLVAQTQTIYVDVNATGTKKGTSWTNAFMDLQEALDSNMAGSVDTILIAEGTYYPNQSPDGTTTDARDRAFHLADNNVVILGGYDASAGTQTGDTTFLSGDLVTAGIATDSAYHVFITRGLSTATLIDHIVITAGSAKGSGYISYASSTFQRNYGGGMFNNGYPNGSSPTLTNCTFTSNYAGWGGGMYNYRSSPTLTNCVFIGNRGKSSGGGMYNHYLSSPTLTNCVFTNNTASHGGGMYNSISAPTLTEVTFSGNYARYDGGGMYSYTSSFTLTLTNCVFASNYANSAGGGMYISTSTNTQTSLTNCVFVSNYARYYGGGMSINYGSPKLTNCVFTGNSATYYYGGGIYSASFGSPILTNTYFFKNTASSGKAIYNTGYSLGSNSTNNASDRDLGRFPTSSGQVRIDLSGKHYRNLIVDSTDLDGPDNIWGTEDDGLRLVPNAVLRDAGTATGAPAKDITDYTRPTPPSIGAYEYIPCSFAQSVLYVDVNASGNETGTSWANAYTDLQEALDARMGCNGIDTILIAEGTYYPTQSPDGTTTNARDRAFHLANNNVVILGGYDAGAGTQTGNTTFLSGDIGTAGTTSDNCYHVLITRSLSASTIIDKVVFTAANANGSGSITYASRSFDRYQGGGMYNYSSSPTLTRVTFTGNKADLYGGGMNNYRSSPTLTNVTFSGNTARFYGGGMYNRSSSSPTLTNVTFSGNTASIFYGGGMYNQSSSSPSLTNVTFSGNSANVSGGGMYNTSSSPTLINTVFYRNIKTGATTVSDISGAINAASTHNASDGTGGAISTTNATTFVDLSGKYYKDLFADSTDLDGPDNIWGTEDDGLRLVPNAVLRDAGTATGAPAKDITGYTRPTPPSIGAYEFYCTDTDTMITLTACDSFTSPSGKIWYTSATYLDTIENAAGCDSLFTITVTINNATSASITTEALNTYTSPSGVVKTVSEVFNDTIPNTALCDSVITINLTVKYNPIYVDINTAGSETGNSFANGFKNLQEAFDYAMANEVDTVFVAEGSYCPDASPFGGTNPKDYAFYLADSNLVILGGFNSSTGLAGNPTILCAAISGTDTSRHVVVTAGLDTNSRVENLTITGGRAGGNTSYTKGGRTYYSFYGGGVYNNLSSPVFKNVTITGNQSTENGGGMYNYTSAPCLENTTIENNKAGYDGGGLYNIAGSSPKLNNVTIQGNTAANNGGGVMNVSSCNPKMNTVLIKNNAAGIRGGGMYSRSSSSAVMNGVVVDSNSAGYYGGGMFNNEYSSPSITNVSFSNNSAMQGGAMYNFYQSSPSIVGATFYNNSGSTSGGAMYNSSSMPTIKNSLFFANSDDIVNSSSMVFGSYNASDKGTSSKANVGSGFVNLSGQAAKDVFKDSADLNGADNVWMTTDDGLMAKLCNSAIDAGSNSNVPSGITKDITGASRIAGAKVDMGAYESVYNDDFSLPTTAGTYYSNKTFTNGSWIYYCDCSTQSVLLALDTTGSGAVVPNTGVGLKIGNYPTISWPNAGGLITNSKGGAMIDRRWNVSPTTQPTGTVSVKYFFTNSEYIALKDTLANHNGGTDPTTITAVTQLNMYKITNNATFQDPHASGINGLVLANDATPSTTKWAYAAYGSDHEAEFKVTSFSGGGGGSGGGNAPLPVELINFTATPIANHEAKLDWATASEMNNSHFNVERSYDGKNFKAIDRVEGHGNSNEVLVYNYIDNTIEASQNTVYYRLHQFDFDGQSEYTIVRRVDFSLDLNLDLINVYPNPFRNEVFISTNNLETESYTITVTAMNGAEVMKLEVTDNLELQRLDMTELSHGMYLLSITTDNATQHFRIIKD